MIKAVIFDLDGTIGNTLPLCVAAFRKAVEPLAGRSLSDREIMDTFGPSEEGTIMSLIPGHYEQGLKDYLAHYERLHDMSPAPFKGMREIINNLKSAGIKIALVTGKGIHSCRITLQRYEMDDLFEEVQTGSPHGPSKVAGINAVLEIFDLQPSEALYVGDSPSDITACREVGIPVIAAAWAETADPAELAAMEPDHIFHTIEEFGDFIKQA